MFKKITSKRDPNISFWDALQAEFSHYLEKADTRFGNFCGRSPRLLFGVMVTLLVLSAALSFTLFRHPGNRSPALAAQKQATGQKSRNLVDDSFARILGTGAALQQTLSLKQRLERLLAKKQLSSGDSLALGQALDSLQLLQHQLQQP